MSRLSTFAGYLSIINLVDNVNWPPERVSKLTFRALAIRQSEFLSQSNELPLIGSLRVAMFTSWRSQKSVRKHLPCLLFSPTNAAPQFLQKLTPFIHNFLRNQVYFSNIARCQFSRPFCLSRLTLNILWCHTNRFQS